MAEHVNVVPVTIPEPGEMLGVLTVGALFVMVADAEADTDAP